MGEVSRREFLVVGLNAAGAAGAAAIGTAASGAAEGAARPAAAAAPAPPARRFFTPAETRFVDAAVARLIPNDELGPGALEAGVPGYLDLQLGGAWGAGERLYRSGPFREGVPGQGYQLPFTPAELFRTALRAIDEDVRRRHGTTFDRLSGPDQDAYLTALQQGTVDLGPVPSKVFFQSLLAMTIEGYFADPVYGGNRDMVAWRMIGFPGAYANYYHLVDQHGLDFRRAPLSIGSDASGHVHVAPDRTAYGGAFGPEAHEPTAGHGGRIAPPPHGNR
jgi:gluconate 2-dehydrogenase gamma chain